MIGDDFVERGQIAGEQNMRKMVESEDFPMLEKEYLGDIVAKY